MKKVTLIHKYGCGKSFIFKLTKEQKQYLNDGYSIDITCPHCKETSPSGVLQNLIQGAKND